MNGTKQKKLNLTQYEARLTGKVAQMELTMKSVLAAIRQTRDDVQAMATVVDSCFVRDKLLRKIILRILPINTVAAAPEHVRSLLIEAGMITDTNSGNAGKADDDE